MKLSTPLDGVLGMITDGTPSAGYAHDFSVYAAQGYDPMAFDQPEVASPFAHFTQS